jgi:uncharacterized protein YcbX
MLFCKSYNLISEKKIKQTLMAQVTDLWVFPIKACRGIQVKTWKICDSGLVLDRKWCIVDLEGTRYPKLQMISQRMLQKLATVAVEISEDHEWLYVSAEGMPVLSVPVNEAAYEGNEDIVAQAQGVDWNLGSLPCKSAGAEAQAWFSKYLNEVDSNAAAKKKPPAKFALVRSADNGARKMEEYPPIFDIIEKRDKDKPGGNYSRRFEKNKCTFYDFAPFLLINEDSVSEVARLMGVGSYPSKPFRASITVKGDGKAFAEETWGEFKVKETGMSFIKIKECPRCHVPCVNQETGEWEVKKRPFLFTKSLKQKYPDKVADPEWGNTALIPDNGSWSNAVAFGVYFGHSGAAGRISVGDTIEIVKKTTYHADLPLTYWGLTRLRRWADDNPVQLALTATAMIGTGLAVAFALRDSLRRQ